MFMTVLLMVVYQTLQFALLPFLVPILFILNAKRAIFGNIAQRMGFVPKTNRKHNVVWIHAVSVGEVFSVEQLITRIKEKQPDTVCYLTVGTTGGMKMAHNAIAADYISFLPYDFGPFMLLAYLRIKPSSIIIVEAELWPNFLSIGKLTSIPMFWLNARINPRSARRISTFKFIFKILINCFQTILAQSNDDKNSFIKLGVSPQKITVLGNLKTFNVIAKKNNYLATVLTDNHESYCIPTLFAGSIHPQEDCIYFELFKKLKPQFPTLKLILAPRHFSWGEQLQTNAQKTNFPFFIWNETSSIFSQSTQSYTQALTSIFKNHDIVLVCKLGELFPLYRYATIYYLGGTMIPHGGHNLLEPAAWQIPTIIGPYHHNSTDIVRQLEHCNGIIKVQSNTDLYDKTKELLANPTLRTNIGNASYTWVNKEARLVQKTLDNLISRIT